MMQNYEHQLDSSIEVVAWTNRDFEAQFIGHIKDYYSQLRQILSKSPSMLKVKFDDSRRPEYGVTGHAQSADEMAIIIDPNATSEQIKKELRPLIFHEGYHILDGFHYNAGIFSGLESAIFEGKAVVFEMKYTESDPDYAHWQDESDKLMRWYADLKQISAEQYFEESGDTWRKWAFFDKDTGEKFKTYKLGTYIIECVIEQRSIDIVDLCGESPRHILEWFEECNSLLSLPNMQG